MKDLQEFIKNEVKDYKFEPLVSGGNAEPDFVPQDFNFEPLDREKIIDVEKHEKLVKLQRSIAKENNFEISPIVREHRGINRQEELERERRIREEVEKRLVKIEKEAYQKGYEEGLVSAQEEVFNQTRAETEEKLSHLTNLISEVLNARHEILHKERQSVYELIRHVSKWIVLRELKDDGEYIVRLLSKLVTEMQTKSNVLVQVDKKSFETMPDILEHVERGVGKLENVRLEVEYDIDGPGIILESENGIINGTLKEQMKSLDKLFKSVGLEPEQTTEEGFYDDELGRNEAEITDTEVETEQEPEDDNNE